MEQEESLPWGDFITLEGVAYRTSYESDITKRINNLIVDHDLLVYNLSNRFVERILIGKARVVTQPNGDIFANAYIKPESANELVGRPFLSAVIEINDDEPSRLVELSVADQVVDPHQMPYRIVGLPPGGSDILQHGYGAVVVVDEACMAALSLNDDGSIEPILDTKKSHIEYRHSEERRRIHLRDAIARGFEYDSWLDLNEDESTLVRFSSEGDDSNEVLTRQRANEILSEVIKALGNA